MRLVYVVLLVILVGIIGIGIFAENHEIKGPDTEQPAQYTDLDAYIDAQAVVERYLVSPSTAKFPSSSNADVVRNGDIFIVSSYVDSENSFGATLRSGWTVEFKSVGNQIAIQSVIIGDTNYR